MGATFASTLLGFLREVVSARYYGTRWEMDTFLAAATIPTILFGVFNGALVSALVPTFSEYIAHREEDEAWRLASTVLNMLAIAVTLCAVVGYFTARWYVPLIAHGFPAPQMSVAIRMTRWLMPSIVAVSLNGNVRRLLPETRSPDGIVIAAKCEAAGYDADVLEVGDILHEVNGHPIHDVVEFRSYLLHHPPHEPLVLQVERMGDLKYMPITAND